MSRGSKSSRTLGPKELDDLRVPQGNAYSPLTDSDSEPAKEKWIKSKHPYISLNGLLRRLYLKHCLEVILILGKKSIKWRHHPGMTIIDDWDVKHHFF